MTDEFLEAEFAASASYWSGRARHYEAVEANRKALEERFARGQVVRVVKGRKIPKGTLGTVFWFGSSEFRGVETYRVGMVTPDGEKHFTAVSNVEPVEGLTEIEESLARVES